MVTVMVTDPDTKVETINERQSIISGLVVTTSGQLLFWFAQMQAEHAAELSWRN